MLTHVAHTVDATECALSEVHGAKVEAKSVNAPVAPAGGDAGLEALLGDVTGGAHLPAHSDPAHSGAVCPEVYRHGDTAGQLGIGLRHLVPRGITTALVASGRRVSAASQGADAIAAHCNAMGVSGGHDRHGPQRHRLYHTSTLSAGETDVVRRVRLLEELVGETSVGEEWTIIEPLARETLAQVLTEALRTGCKSRDVG